MLSTSHGDGFPDTHRDKFLRFLSHDIFVVVTERIAVQPLSLARTISCLHSRPSSLFRNHYWGYCYTRKLLAPLWIVWDIKNNNLDRAKSSEQRKAAKNVDAERPMSVFAGVGERVVAGMFGETWHGIVHPSTTWKRSLLSEDENRKKLSRCLSGKPSPWLVESIFLILVFCRSYKTLLSTWPWSSRSPAILHPVYTKPQSIILKCTL